MTKPVDLVRAFYAAVSTGDGPGVVSLLHRQLEWTEAEGFPYYSGVWTEPRHVVERLLVPLMGDWDGFTAIAWSASAPMRA
jgi:ketosteroid isomerase-like protein